MRCQLYSSIAQVLHALLQCIPYFDCSWQPSLHNSNIALVSSLYTQTFVDVHDVASGQLEPVSPDNVSVSSGASLMEQAQALYQLSLSSMPFSFTVSRSSGSGNGSEDALFDTTGWPVIFKVSRETLRADTNKKGAESNTMCCSQDMQKEHPAGQGQIR